MDVERPHPSIPTQSPGQGNCPPGYRPTSYPGLQPGASACAPIGPGVPQGGWRPDQPYTGPGMPPSAAMAAYALESSLPGVGGGTGLGAYLSSYEDWIRAMLAR